jgi:hypothetical protein
MYVHDTLQRFQRPNFRQRAIAASQLYGAMRKSRQPRCIAAISAIAVAEALKLLAAERNLAWAIFRALPAAGGGRSRRCLCWHQVKQSLPDA